MLLVLVCEVLSELSCLSYAVAWPRGIVIEQGLFLSHANRALNVHPHLRPFSSTSRMLLNIWSPTLTAPQTQTQTPAPRLLATSLLASSSPRANSPRLCFSLTS